MKPSALLLALSLLLTGCRASAPDTKTAKELLTRPFEAEATIEWEEERYDARLNRTAEGTLSVELRSEALISPVTFCCREGGLELKLGELSLRLPREEAPPGGLVTTLFRAIERLDSSPLELSGETLIASAGEFRLSVDPQSGLPLTLELGRGRLVFSNFTYVTQAPVIAD